MRDARGHALLEPGAIFGGYRIDAVLGRGGMGVVFEATQLSLNRKAALKVVAAHLASDVSFRERFRREGLLQAAIDHPNILTVYEAGEDQGLLFLAMRLVRGTNLKQLVESGAMTVERTLNLLGQAASGLDAAHAAGLIHRDIKPQNILVDRTDYVYLADFGLTRALGEQSLTKTGVVLGTLDYISPEQIKGDPPTGRIDVYAFAAVLYECLVGQPPFPRDVEAAVMYAHLSEDPPAVTGHRPDLPPAINSIVAKGLAKSPEERYATAGDLVRDVRDALSTSHSATTLPSRSKASARTTVGYADAALAGLQATTPRKKQRGARVWGSLGMATGIAAVAAGGFAMGNTGSVESGEAASFAAAGPIELGLPKGWHRLSRQPTIPGLELTDAIAVGPREGGTGLIAGRTQAIGVTLLPDALRSSAEIPRRVAVRLGSYEAYRYRGLRPRARTHQLTVYAVPTNRGVVTLVCFAPMTASVDPFLSCERVAATLTLSDVRTYPLGPNRQYADSLRKTIAALSAARSALRRVLGEARTPRGQADAARGIAEVYAGAARRQASVEASPEVEAANQRIVASLRLAASAYSRLAVAAGQRKRALYSPARASTAAAEAKVRRALRALSALGYSLATGEP
jgi:hypothetical protein